MIIAWEYEFIYWLQLAPDWLIKTMGAFSALGLSTPYMVVVAFIYWTYDRNLATKAGSFLILNALLNELFKQLIQAPRPYWVNESIKGLDPSQGYGMPSGHAQASIFWVYLAVLIEKKWLWVLAIIMTLGIGTSRFWLGAHFPTQVAIGWFVGLLVLLLFSYAALRITSFFNSKSVIIQISYLTLGCCLSISLCYSILNLTSIPAAYPDWLAKAKVYIETDSLYIGEFESFINTIAALYGLLTGFILSRSKKLPNQPSASFIKRVPAFFLGLSLLFLLQHLINLVPLPAWGLMEYVFIFLNSSFLTFSISFVIPLILYRSKLLS